MSEQDLQLAVPGDLPTERKQLLIEVAKRNNARHRDGLLGLVLSGSVGRGMATARSDVDLYVVLAEDPVRDRATSRSDEIDEIPISLTDLETSAPFGGEGWWFRWSFAWAPVLLDRTHGRLPAALQRQATLTDTEANEILIRHDRLDGWLNYAYRALKNDRDGRCLERRLDAAESMPWLLDVIFSLAGRVRPYHKYLPWELREHPLPDWPADVLLQLLERTLDGDPEAIKETFARVEGCCIAHDAVRPEQPLTDTIYGWGDELRIFRD